jgi:hypothetical protein
MLLIDGMHGLGDNIYQRAFIREIKDTVYLRTCWPQLYCDLSNVLPVKQNTRLRTQKTNIDRQPGYIWNSSPIIRPAKKIRYGNALLRGRSILDEMRICFGIDAKKFDLPVFDLLPIKKPYAVVRPVTIREEWKNPARNPEPQYIVNAAIELKKSGFTTISVADLQNGIEWSPLLPECDIIYNNGELVFDELMGLIRGASVVVGGVGWIVPAAIAAGVPLIVILGGQGGYNAPEKITGKPMCLEKVQWIYPDNFCRCVNKMHQCNKTITEFENRFRRVLLNVQTN